MHPATYIKRQRQALIGLFQKDCTINIVRHALKADSIIDLGLFQAKLVDLDRANLFWLKSTKGANRLLFYYPQFKQSSVISSNSG